MTSPAKLADEAKLAVGAERQDAELAGRLLEGDQDALREFYEQNFDAVYRFVYLLVGAHHEDAEEAVQNTFLAAIQSIKSFRHKSSLKSWLYGIARHKASDIRRRRSVWFGLREKLPGVGGTPASVSEPPDQAAALRVHLEQVLQSLPAAQREVLLLKYVQELRVEEIARVVGRSPKAVESTLSRARANFRRAYGLRQAIS